MSYGRKHDALPRLPEPPKLSLNEIEDVSPHDPGGFLRLRRKRFVARYPDGTESRPFPYDAVERRDFDAAVMAAHFAHEGERYVYLRSSLRPPSVMRPESSVPAVFWELPAGLIEPEEQGPAGRKLTAQRELLEELGFEVELGALHELGPGVCPAVGIIAEVHFGFEVEVDPDLRGEPTCDGSPLEHGGVVLAVPLRIALDACDTGAICDGKTELFLRRLDAKLHRKD